MVDKGDQVERTMSWKPDPRMSERQAEKEVQKIALEFEEKCRNTWNSSTMKFKTLAEKWFEEYGEMNLRHTSLERMKQLRERLYPVFGHIAVGKINTFQIQSFINDLSKNGKNFRNGKPLSRKTIVHHLSLISDVFTYAIRMGMVTDNPCSRVVVPKGEAKEKEIYSIEEMGELLRLLETVPLKYRCFFVLAAYSGFRKSELLGLEWKDIDWESGLISVRRTSNYTKATGIYTDTTKTKKSQRTQRLPDTVMSILKALKAEQDEERMRLGNKWVETDRLFVKWNGEPINTRTHDGWFREFCKDHDFKFCTIHSFRHFYASALINANVDVATVSSAMGHSVIGTTTNIYTHVFEEANARAADAITSVLDFSKKEKKEEKSDEPTKIHVVRKVEHIKPSGVLKIKKKKPPKDTPRAGKI